MTFPDAAPPFPPPLIEAVGLTKRYNDSPGAPLAVDDVSLSVAPGELFGFLGENGAGKTTTIKMLTGLIPPTHGAARIGGWDVRTEPLQAKQQIGYIPDNPFLYDKLTGREFLRFMADLWRVPGGSGRDARIADLLTLSELSDKADALIGSYSRGMRQKIALAGALIHHPRALFLDEPTVGLDPRSTRRLQEILRTVCTQQNAAVFLSTHVLSVAAGLCDRIGVLHRGRLVALGTPAELTENNARSLEDVFLSLTGGAGEHNAVARLLGGSGSGGGMPL